MVIEGVIALERLVAGGRRPLTVVSLAGRENQVAHLVDRSTEWLVAPQSVLDEVVGFKHHRGTLAVAERPPLGQVEHLVGRVLAVEGVNDGENMGALMRSALALGAEGVLLDPTSADPWYRRSIRVSMGAVFALKVARSKRWPDDLSDLRAAGSTIVALSPRPDAELLGDYVADGPTVILVGGEGAGLSREALAVADRILRIPMAGAMDSINVGHAFAIAAHHCWRLDQR